MSGFKGYISKIWSDIKQDIIKGAGRLTAFMKKKVKTEDFTDAYSPTDIAQNKWFAFLCYIPIVCIFIIIFKMRSSAFVKFHANQGIAVFLISVISTVLSAVVFSLIRLSVLGVLLSVILSVFFGLIDLANTFLALFGMFFSALGRARVLPFFGRIRIFK